MTFLTRYDKSGAFVFAVCQGLCSLDSARRTRGAMKYHRRLCGRLVISDQREGPGSDKVSHDVTAIETRKLNIDRVSRRDQAAPSRETLYVRLL